VEQDRLYNAIRALPKVELHRHLEGSLRLETLIDIARGGAFEMPEYDVEMLRPFVQMMPGERRDWQHFLGKFATIRQFFRSPEIIDRVTREAIEDAARDNIAYIELRFTPRALGLITHTTPRDVVGWVCTAAREASRACGITARLIVSMNRHESVEFGEQALDAALAHGSNGVVGVDLAGQESGFPATLFRPIFLKARAAGLGVTVHAGEWEGAYSVWDAVGNLGADRVGHGIRCLEDAGIVRVLIERGVPLEVCPTSNCDTGVVADAAAHPLAAMTAAGLRTTINTDDPLISNITLSDEMTRAVTQGGMTFDDVKDATLRAAGAAFLPDSDRRALTRRLRKESSRVRL
jgi:adenosine deaminase